MFSFLRNTSVLCLCCCSGLRYWGQREDHHNLGLYTIQRGGDEEPEDVGIVIKGIKVLNKLGSVIMGFIMLLGLIYALDVSFPENLRYTFVVFQKIMVNLDGLKVNAKIQQLKTEWFAREVNTSWQSSLSGFLIRFLGVVFCFFTSVLSWMFSLFWCFDRID